MQINLKATSPLNEWLSYLENSHYKSIDLGLERVKGVAQAMDLLRPAPFVITVGGTNGKGTTCRLLETILLNAGLRVGVYSSPHLLRYNERVRIQNQELPDEQHTASFAFIEQSKNSSLTYFEFSTLSALYLFKQAELDVVILEVGLGGRLDATNIIDADIAVITSIDIDHVDFLGDSREKIAYEKAGIFRSKQCVVIGEPDVPSMMLTQAQKLDCLVSQRGKDWAFQQNGTDWDWQGQKKDWKTHFSHLPLCQIPLANAATALATVQMLPFEISEQVIRQSLAQVQLIGRFQCIEPIKLQPLATVLNKPLSLFPKAIIDVGHNPHAARYLAEQLNHIRTKTAVKIYAVFGLLRDKDANGVVQPLLSQIDYWYCVGLDGERGQSGEELQQKVLYIAQQQIETLLSEHCLSVKDGVINALQKARAEDIVLIFGSFHTVGAFLELIE
ncbi:MAG: bifunctional tetrahydrofolate synthase/dihydrofolate synthase [Pasteurellaceae bacterium]|nr:bifunctional tetrahydrofolate synthase/dihydrofolate synthase [Pasteurellaceae bacterium]